MSSTSKQRDYTVSDPQGGHVIITTDRVSAAISLGVADQSVQVAFDRDTARDVGTALIAWASSPTVAAYDEWTGTNGAAFEINIDVDGADVEFSAANNGVAMLTFFVTCDDAVDMGQRLIVWAGVDRSQ